jgi:uncharacterized surface protein with fasciclin (FAS1) repeats
MGGAHHGDTASSEAGAPASEEAMQQQRMGAPGTTTGAYGNAQQPQGMTTPGNRSGKADIVDKAEQQGRFTTFTKALQAANLTDTLKGPGPFTVFAPTDEAFAALPPGKLDSLMQPENREELIRILTYHVVPGNVRSSEVIRLKEATTVEGDAVKITAPKGMRRNVMVNDAKIVQTDIGARNGVIHVIDKVLMPESGQHQ